jgi:predicted PurR-regulated permease PerM
MRGTDGQDTRTGRELTRLHLWQIQGVRDVLVVAAVVGVLWLGYALRFVTVPLLVALGLAYLVEPLVQSMCRRLRMSRPAAVGGILATFGVGLVVLMLVTVPLLVSQTTSLMQNVRAGKFDGMMSRIEQALPEAYQSDLARVRETFLGTTKTPPASTPTAAATATPAAPVAAPPLPPAPAPAAQGSTPSDGPDDRPVPSLSAEPRSLVVRGADVPLIESVLGPTATAAMARIVDITALAFAAFLVPFYFWFFSIGFPDTIGFLRKLVPDAHKARIEELASEMDRAVSAFVRGRIVIAAIMGLLLAVGWKVGGVPYAFTLGFVGGLLSIVPYLGALAVLPAVALLSVDQLALPEVERMAWYWMIGGPVLVFVIVQSIEGYVLTPVIAGRATNLGPVSVFVAVLAGASLAGVYGMLLAIPAAACIKILASEMLMPALREWAAGRASDPLPIDRD